MYEPWQVIPRGSLFVWQRRAPSKSSSDDGVYVVWLHVAEENGHSGGETVDGASRRNGTDSSPSEYKRAEKQ